MDEHLKRMAARIAEGESGRKKLTLEEALVADPKDVELEPNEERGDVKIHYLFDVAEALFGKDWFMDPEKYIPYEVKQEGAEAWAEAHGAILYEAPREEFSVAEAAGLAKEQGKSRAVVNDLS